jgi:hypothetical protein
MEALISPAPRPGFGGALGIIVSGMLPVLGFLGCAMVVALMVLAISQGFRQVRDNRDRDQADPQPSAPWTTPANAARHPATVALPWEWDGDSLRVRFEKGTVPVGLDIRGRQLWVTADTGEEFAHAILTAVARARAGEARRGH